MFKRVYFVIFGIILAIIVAMGCFFVPEKKPELQTTTILFDKNGNTPDYKLTGFGIPEKEFTWTIEKESTVSIPVSQIPDGYGFLLSVDAVPFLAKKIKKQTISVFVNDIFVDKWVFDGPMVHNVILPDTVLNQSGIINIKFQTDNKKSPKNLKISSDTRLLGIAVKKLILTPVDLKNPKGFHEYKIGEKLELRMDGNSEDYLGQGWSLCEKRFTWTDDKNAYVNMFVKNAAGKRLQLVVSGHCIYDPEINKNQKITVYVNDTELEKWDCVREENVYRVVLPESVIGDGAIQIRFNIDNPFSPGSDTRSLGMAVRTLQLTGLSSSRTKVKIALWLKKLLKVPENPITEETKQ